MARIAANGEVDWYNTDNLGSVRQIIGAEGAILNEIDYDSFGNVLNETSPSEGDRFKFTAREWESAVDLYFYRARWYESATGRFISEDPIGFQAGDPNLVRYALNSPAVNTDPSGLISIQDIDPTSDVQLIGFAIFVGAQNAGYWFTLPLQWAGIDFSDQEQALNANWEALEEGKGVRRRKREEGKGVRPIKSEEGKGVRPIKSQNEA